MKLNRALWIFVSMLLGVSADTHASVLPDPRILALQDTPSETIEHTLTCLLQTIRKQISTAETTVLTADECASLSRDIAHMLAIVRPWLSSDACDLDAFEDALAKKIMILSSPNPVVRASRARDVWKAVHGFLHACALSVGDNEFYHITVLEDEGILVPLSCIRFSYYKFMFTKALVLDASKHTIVSDWNACVQLQADVDRSMQKLSTYMEEHAHTHPLCRSHDVFLDVEAAYNSLRINLDELKREAGSDSFRDTYERISFILEALEDALAELEPVLMASRAQQTPAEIQIVYGICHRFQCGKPVLQAGGLSIARTIATWCKTIASAVSTGIQTAVNLPTYKRQVMQTIHTINTAAQRAEDAVQQVQAHLDAAQAFGTTPPQAVPVNRTNTHVPQSDWEWIWSHIYDSNTTAKKIIGYVLHTYLHKKSKMPRAHTTQSNVLDKGHQLISKAAQTLHKARCDAAQMLWNEEFRALTARNRRDIIASSADSATVFTSTIVPVYPTYTPTLPQQTPELKPVQGMPWKKIGVGIGAVALAALGYRFLENAAIASLARAW